MVEKEPRELSEEEREEEAVRASKERDEELRRVIEKGFGKETLETAEHISHRILDKAIKMHLLEKENPEEAKKTLEIWEKFADRIYQRLTSVNLRNPEMVETVLKMTTALVQPEADRKGENDVKEGVKIIESRYGGTLKEVL